MDSSISQQTRRSLPSRACRGLLPITLSTAPPTPLAWRTPPRAALRGPLPSPADVAQSFAARERAETSRPSGPSAPRPLPPGPEPWALDPHRVAGALSISLPGSSRRWPRPPPAAGSSVADVGRDGVLGRGARIHVQVRGCIEVIQILGREHRVRLPLEDGTPVWTSFVTMLPINRSAVVRTSVCTTTAGHPPDALGGDPILDLLRHGRKQPDDPAERNPPAALRRDPRPRPLRPAMALSRSTCRAVVIGFSSGQTLQSSLPKLRLR